MSWLLDAFFEWLRGKPIQQLIGAVNPSSRFLPMALPIAGWSHVWGGLMKNYCSRYQRWPEVLELLRLCVCFFKNQVYSNDMIEPQNWTIETNTLCVVYDVFETCLSTVSHVVFLKKADTQYCGPGRLASFYETKHT